MILYLRCLSTRRRRAVYVFARLFRCSRPLLGNFAAPARPREQMPVVRASGSKARATSDATQRLRQPLAGFNARMLTRRTRVAHACVLPAKCTKLAPGCLVPLQALARHRFALGRLLGAATPRLRRVAREVRHMQNRRPGEQPQRHQYQLAPVARGPGRTAPVGPGRQPPQAARAPHTRTGQKQPGAAPSSHHGSPRHERPEAGPASPITESL